MKTHLMDRLREIYERRLRGVPEEEKSAYLPTKLLLDYSEKQLINAINLVRMAGHGDLLDKMEQIIFEDYPNLRILDMDYFYLLFSLEGKGDEYVKMIFSASIDDFPEIAEIQRQNERQTHLRPFNHFLALNHMKNWSEDALREFDTHMEECVERKMENLMERTKGDAKVQTLIDKFRNVRTDTSFARFAQAEIQANASQKIADSIQYCEENFSVQLSISVIRR